MLGLTARQLICSAVAIILAAGTYLGLEHSLGRQAASWLCLLAAAPFAVAGFFQYNGMTFEQFLSVWFKLCSLCGRNRPNHTENVYYAALERKERDDYD